MKYNPEYSRKIINTNISAIHHRRSIRLKNYDYSQEGLYFITLCVQNRQHIFGEIKSGELFLNPLGKITDEEWENTPNIRKNISLGEASIWQRNYYEHIIRTEKAYQNISNYINQNPKNWDSDKFINE